MFSGKKSRSSDDTPVIIVLGTTCMCRSHPLGTEISHEKLGTTSCIEGCGGNAANVAASLSLLSTAKSIASGDEKSAVRVLFFTKVGEEFG